MYRVINFSYHADIEVSVTHYNQILNRVISFADMQICSYRVIVKNKIVKIKFVFELMQFG